MTTQYAYSLAPTTDSDDAHLTEDREPEDSATRPQVAEEDEERGWTCCRCGLLCRLKGIVKSNVGLLLVVASQAFMSLMNVSVKKLNSLDPPVPALELVVVRMVITYIFCMTYMLSRGVSDPWMGPKGVRLLLVFRGITGFVSLFGLYFSLQYLSLSDAVVLTFLAPLATAISGTLLLGESFSRKQALAGLCSLFGVLLIARPAFLFGGKGPSSANPAFDPSQRLIAVGVALLGVLGATGAYTTLRAIGKRAHPLHSMTSFSAQCVIFASVGMVVTRTHVVLPTKIEWMALLLMIGLCGFMGQVLLTMGLQRETASRGSLGVYTQIVFAGILEQIFFHTAPSILSTIGTIIIISSALYVVLARENSSPNSAKNIPSDDAEMEEGLLAQPQHLQAIDHLEMGELGGLVGGHVSVEDFRTGVTSPSMKRSASPMSKVAPRLELKDDDFEELPLTEEKR